jgi:hypothetical protein
MSTGSGGGAAATGLNQLLVADYVPEKREAAVKPTTLEAHHQQKMRQFAAEKERLAEYREELEDLETRLLEVPPFTDEWRVMSDQAEGLRKQIRALEMDAERLNYFLDVGDLLFQYYDVQEGLAKGALRTEPAVVKAPTLLTNSVLSYFATPGAGAGAGAGASAAAAASTGEKKTVRASDIDTTEGLNRDKLLEKYLAIVDPTAIKSGYLPGSGIEPGWGCCPACSVEMIFYQNEATLCCPGCGHEEFILIDSEKPSYKDPPREITYFAYKKANHFNEWLAQFQAKENTDIPAEVIDAVLAELRKERITDPKKIKNPKILEILRKLKFSKMYDHVQQIRNRIQQQMTSLTLSKETEEKLQHMFKEIQPAFIKFCPKGRSNFLSYPYVLYKMCQLLEMDEFLPCFQLLKSREKLYQQDQVWQKICAELGWQFIRSI